MGRRRASKPHGLALLFLPGLVWSSAPRKPLAPDRGPVATSSSFSEVVRVSTRVKAVWAQWRAWASMSAVFHALPAGAGLPRRTPHP